MAHQSDLIASNIEAYLKEHENKELLRFITCGSVDDGKSTLIGRLLHDSKMIFEDQLATITQESKKMGTTGDDIDLALLVDGLQSEREQGITIDVAYRYFSTEKRKFIIADTPGHEQYTRNMATGASTADLAIILIDARYGVQTQTRRHSYIVKLLGIPHVIVAINKMDIIEYSQERFEAIRTNYLDFAKEIGLNDIQVIPLSALKGDNVVNTSKFTPWYQGDPLMSLLDTIEISSDRDYTHFRLPVQYVNRPNLDFRGFSGTIASGTISVGDAITVLPSRKTSTVKSIVTYDGNLHEAYAEMAVTLTLNDEIDISRGDLIVKSSNIPELSRFLDVNIVWMHETPLTLGKNYFIKCGAKVCTASIEYFYYKTNVNTLQNDTATELSINEIGHVKLSLSEPIAFDSYEQNRLMGSFILIDRINNNTVGAGMIVKASQTEQQSTNKSYSNFEIELNSLIRKHFPHWESHEIF